MVNVHNVKEFPVFMLVDDRRGWFGFLIKQHSEGNYNHIAELFMPGFLASQDMVDIEWLVLVSILKGVICSSYGHTEAKDKTS